MTVLGHTGGSSFESWTGGWLCGLAIAEVIIAWTLRKSNVRSSK
jgi:hypothetical protein